MRAALGVLLSSVFVLGSLPGGAAAGSEHPRIFLDSNTLDALRERARANSPAWQALRQRCELHTGSKVEWPDGDDYPPNGIGEGYQGDGYFGPLLGLGLCYQVALDVEPGRAPAYAAVGAQILKRMSAIKGKHATPPLRDSGYGVRFFGSGMAIGFDWFYDALTPKLRKRVYKAINRWIGAFEDGGFGNDFPVGNYFAGYYAAKAYGALATEGDNPLAEEMWDDWLNRVHRGAVQPYYALNLPSGGWPEGWNYGPQAVVSMSLPALAVKTAKGIDLVHDAAAPYPYPLANPRFLTAFTWPDGTTMEDSGSLYEGDDPSGLRGWFVTIEAGLLRAFDDPLASDFESFAQHVRASTPSNELGLDWDQWSNFLFESTDPIGAPGPQPLSHHANGIEMASMRSSSDANARWAALRFGPYIAYDQAAREWYDHGSLAITNGDRPFLVNATAALLRHTPGTQDGGQYFDDIEANLNGDAARRDFFNIFYVEPPADTGQGTYGRQHGNGSQISAFEDGGSYVFARGSSLEGNYPATPDDPKSIASWTRDVIYLRPGRFVVDDRTTITDSATDQWMAFHVGAEPIATASTSGVNRFDIGTGADYRGTVQTVNSSAAATGIVNVFDSNKVFRLEVRPAASALTQRWLTVFDAAASPADAAAARPVSVTAGNVVGVLLVGSSTNEVVLGSSGPAGQAVGGTISYTIPATDTTHVVRDLQPGATFTVTATGTGTQTITLSPGGPFTASPAGVLTFASTAQGQVNPDLPQVIGGFAAAGAGLGESDAIQ